MLSPLAQERVFGDIIDKTALAKKFSLQQIAEWKALCIFHEMYTTSANLPPSCIPACRSRQIPSWTCWGSNARSARSPLRLRGASCGGAWLTGSLAPIWIVPPVLVLQLLAPRLWRNRCPLPSALCPAMMKSSWTTAASSASTKTASSSLSPGATLTSRSASKKCRRSSRSWRRASSTLCRSTRASVRSSRHSAPAGARGAIVRGRAD